MKKNMAEHYNEQTTEYLRKLYDPARARRSCHIASLEELLEWQLDARADLFELTGLRAMHQELRDHSPQV